MTTHIDTAGLTLRLVAEYAVDELSRVDPEVAGLLLDEHRYQATTLNLLASSSPAPLSTSIAEGIAFPAVTAEGYPGRRFHSGARNVDVLEELAVERAMRLFAAEHANVQPHSGSSANLAVLFAVLQPGDAILSLDLDSGGHLTHGARASVTGRYFRTEHYGLDPAGLIDLDEVRTRALAVRPKLIICGASAYPRRIDFGAFREIADEAGALLLADISHIAGLVAAQLHPSPIDVADFTTSSTYKQLRGPRGGMILLGERASGATRRRLSRSVDRSVFPGIQGTPSFSAIAAKCTAFERAGTPQFARWAAKIVEDAATLADRLTAAGLALLSGGTDTHLLIADLRDSVGISGYVAEKALERCGCLANRNRVPGDHRAADVTSGLRLGTNYLAARFLSTTDVEDCAEHIVRLLDGVRPVSDTDYQIKPAAEQTMAAFVAGLCARNPVDPV